MQETLGVLVPITIELLQDAAGVEVALENAVTQALALELDRVILRGSGAAAEPCGVRNWTSRKLINKSSGTWSCDDIVNAAEDVMDGNGLPTGIITSPAVWSKRSKMKTGDGSFLPWPYVDQLPWFTTNQVPANLGGGTNESEIYVCDWSKVFIAMRAEIKLEKLAVGTDGTTNALTQLLVWFRAYLRADVLVSQPGHCCVIHGLTN